MNPAWQPVGALELDEAKICAHVGLLYDISGIVIVIDDAAGEVNKQPVLAPHYPLVGGTVGGEYECDNL